METNKLNREEIILLAKETIEKENLVNLDDIVEVIEQISDKYQFTEEEELDYAINVLCSKYCK